MTQLSHLYKKKNIKTHKKSDFEPFKRNVFPLSTPVQVKGQMFFKSKWETFFFLREYYSLCTLYTMLFLLGLHALDSPLLREFSRKCVLIMIC